MLQRPSTRPPRTNVRPWRRKLRAASYLLVIVLLAGFLLHIGPEPWVVAASHWPVLLAVMISIGVGLIVQAKSFQVVTPDQVHALPLLRLAHIWAASSVISIVAPFFAGFATRTALLIRSGMSVSECITASTRQIWMGLEFALLLAALNLPFVLLANSHLLAAAAATGWLSMVAMRKAAAQLNLRSEPSRGRIRHLLQAIGQNVRPRAYPWYFLQIALIGVTFYIGFNGMGAPISWADAVSLAALTVALSLIAFVPNGLGISDSVWVYVAINSGLSLEGSIALAILLRIAHLLSSLLIAVSLSMMLGKITFRL